MALITGPVLAVGAHPDDIEWGAWATLRKAGVPVTALVLTGYGTPRHAETTEALDGVAVVGVRNGQDGELRCAPDVVHAVEPWLDGIRTVLTLTRWDTRQDHRAVEEIVLAACRRRRVTILGYQVPSSTLEFSTQAIVDVSDLIDAKVAALACHRSQASKPYMRRGFIRRWHRDRAAAVAGVRFAECFHVYQIHE